MYICDFWRNGARLARKEVLSGPATCRGYFPRRLTWLLRVDASAAVVTESVFVFVALLLAVRLKASKVAVVVKS